MKSFKQHSSAMLPRTADGSVELQRIQMKQMHMLAMKEAEKSNSQIEYHNSREQLARLRNVPDVHAPILDKERNLTGKMNESLLVEMPMQSSSSGDEASATMAGIGKTTSGGSIDFAVPLFTRQGVNPRVKMIQRWDVDSKEVKELVKDIPKLKNHLRTVKGVGSKVKEQLAREWNETVAPTLVWMEQTTEDKKVLAVINASKKIAIPDNTNDKKQVAKFKNATASNITAMLELNQEAPPSVSEPQGDTTVTPGTGVTPEGEGNIISQPPPPLPTDLPIGQETLAWYLWFMENMDGLGDQSTWPQSMVDAYNTVGGIIDGNWNQDGLNSILAQWGEGGGWNPPSIKVMSEPSSANPSGRPGRPDNQPPAPPRSGDNEEPPGGWPTEPPGGWPPMGGKDDPMYNINPDSPNTLRNPDSQGRQFWEDEDGNNWFTDSDGNLWWYNGNEWIQRAAVLDTGDDPAGWDPATFQYALRPFPGAYQALSPVLGYPPEYIKDPDIPEVEPDVEYPDFDEPAYTDPSNPPPAMPGSGEPVFLKPGPSGEPPAGWYWPGWEPPLPVDPGDYDDPDLFVFDDADMNQDRVKRKKRIKPVRESIRKFRNFKK